MNASRILPFAVVVSVASAFAGPAAAQTAGPFVNPANGHRYYRLSPTLWPVARAIAQGMGGDLLTINDAAENEWVRVNVASAGGNSQQCYTGLNDVAVEGSFAWASGAAVSYVNWAPGEPNNQGNEDYGTMIPATGWWNDVPGTTALAAIVEVAGTIRVPQEIGTIQGAINAALAGGVVEVSPGTYVTRLTINAPITVRSTGGAGATIINGASGGTVVAFGSGAGAGARLEGFTITGGQATVAGGISLGSGSSPMIKGCMIQGNHATAGGAVAITAPSATATLVDCLISGNSATVGAGIYVNGATAVAEVVNCTIAGNSATGGDAYSTANGARLTGRNCIVRGGAIGAATFTFSNVAGVAGEGNINADPMFAPDYSLMAGSPCIDAGANSARGAVAEAVPLDVFRNGRFVDDTAIVDRGTGPGPVVDMGAAEFQGRSGTCARDFNGDGSVDPDDLADFITAFFNGCP